MDLALNNLQRLICHKTQTNKRNLVVAIVVVAAAAAVMQSTI